ncbi:putative secondary metabolism biosynthetic enzyme [Arachnomyces sp. PD_36]|nr:putative secondary metabolism biosynthetic enzyme [Arachnomyces sp. PD_36]
MTTDLPFPSFTRTWHNASYSSIDPSNPQLSAKGKKIVITGGGSGIGAEVARSFARAGAASIAILGRTKSNLLAVKDSVEAQYRDTSVIPIVMDVTDENSVCIAATRIKEEFGGWDVLVSNAGYCPPITRLGDSKTEDWFRGFEVNVKGSYLVAREFIPFAAERDAVLLNVSSGVCHVSPMAGVSSYAPSKLASNKFFEYVQDEHPHIRVTSIHPGVIKTEMGKQVIAAGKDVAVDDIDLAANFILWAASPEAEFARGRMLWSNWDVDELKAKASSIKKNSSLLTGSIDGWAAYFPKPNSSIFARIIAGFGVLDRPKYN